MLQYSTVKFHDVGLKCMYCGSYNSCRTKSYFNSPPAPSSNGKYIYFKILSKY